MSITRSGCFVLIVLLAISSLCLPVTAAQTGGEVSPNELGILRAHLAWTALVTEVEMNAAITYIYPLYGTDTQTLSTLIADFKAMEAQIPDISSRGDYMNLTGEMRSLAIAFRNETTVQLAYGHGNEYELSLQIRAIKENNPYIEEKKNAYWNTRRTNQLSDFDTWILSAQGSLDTLKTQGYDTAKAQRTLDVIGSKRPDLLAALESKNEDALITVNAVLLPLSQQLGQQAEDAQGQVSDAERIRFLVEQGYRAVYRADMLNDDLVRILLDIGPAEPLLKKAKTDLAATSTLLTTGNLQLAKTPLLLVKKDFKDLSMAYRDIGNTADLPPDVAATLKTLIILFDNTADQMEVS